MENSLKEQEKLGIKLDKAQLIAGVQDAFADKSKLSDQEIEMAKMREHMRLMIEKLKATQPSHIASQAEETPPPHY
ncbi:SlyX family protein [Klebsiella pneumoniae]|uniref:SlyX family protein n=1 Tax=Klebsiella pneumoniae TaxID=573 RepID=UPI00214B05F0|nr:SlyX family protein [Klebsiella pneumoniae]